MSNVTLKKLAEELKMSPSTISRSLRDSHEISQETKDRVRALAAKLDFQPNPHASSLRKNKSKTIAVVIPEIQNNFFSQVLNGVEEVARNKGYHVLIYLTHEDYKREMDIMYTLRSGRVDGVMISIANTTTTFEHLAAYEEFGVPLVFFDRVCDIKNVPCITTDDEQSAFIATEHLIQSGCTNIAFLSLSDRLSIMGKRRSGYLRALTQYNLTNNCRIIECNNDDTINRQQIKSLLENDNKIDGVFASVEKFAITTYEVCKEIEIKLPGQLKVITFSNLPAASLFDPALSTIKQPAYDMGRESASILFKIIEKKKLMLSEHDIVIPSSLVLRESSACGKEHLHQTSGEVVIV